jgi:DNA gyrase/topoisomerase IV subunit B
VLNTEQASLQKVLSNTELQDVVSALGCGIGADIKVDRLRYHKIILLMDADSDGHHISTLLLTFFYRHLQPLIGGGFIYLAQPPLYRIDHGKETFWALDDADRDRIVGELPKNASPTSCASRAWARCSPTTSSDDAGSRNAPPAARHRRGRRRGRQGAGELMGKDVEARFKFIMERAAQATSICSALSGPRARPDIHCAWAHAM